MTAPRPERARDPSASRPLFDELVKALEPSLRSVAPFTLTRLLLRARIFDREAMTAAEFAAAWPMIEAGLRESMSTNELADARRRIAAVMATRGTPIAA